MKKLILLALLSSLLLGITACSEGFPDEEMHFGTENKTRPYAVIIDPPEAAPGDTVLVTLYAQTPDLQQLDISWRVALDYDIGLYDEDKTEGRFLDIDVPPAVVDEDGFLTQVFSWVVPDSVHQITSAIPTVLTDPAMIYLAEELIGPEAGSPPAKLAVDAWLKALTAQDMEEMSPIQRTGTWALADIFSCQIRFRVAMWDELHLDVTRNLTVRHTGRLGGPNMNHNADVDEFKLTALHKIDATKDDLEDPQVARTEFDLLPSGENEIPLDANWTYYISTGFHPQQYTSPFDPSLVLQEQAEYRWYFYRKDAPASGHQFYQTEDGEEAEMWNLEEEVRINPASSGSVFRVVSVLRDERGEWKMYHAVPGTEVTERTLRFVDQTP